MIMRNSTWRFPNMGFWAIHIASLAALGYLANRSADCRCHEATADNMSFPEKMPRNQEPGQEESQF